MGEINWSDPLYCEPTREMKGHLVACLLSDLVAAMLANNRGKTPSDALNPKMLTTLDYLFERSCAGITEECSAASKAAGSTTAKMANALLSELDDEVRDQAAEELTTGISGVDYSAIRSSVCLLHCIRNTAHEIKYEYDSTFGSSDYRTFGPAITDAMNAVLWSMVSKREYSHAEVCRWEKEVCEIIIASLQRFNESDVATTTVIGKPSPSFSTEML